MAKTLPRNIVNAVVRGYRQGMTQEQLNRKYHISTSYQLLRNNLSPVQREKLFKQHIKEAAEKSGRKGGKTSFKNKKGCFSKKYDVADARRRGGQKAGLMYGKRNYEAGIGIGKLTYDDLHKHGIKNALARGEIPYDYKKRFTCYGWVTEKEYIVFSAILEDDYTWKDICDEVNKIWQYRGRKKRKFETIRTLYNSQWKPGILEGAIAEGIDVRFMGRKKYKLNK